MFRYLLDFTSVAIAERGRSWLAMAQRVNAIAFAVLFASVPAYAQSSLSLTAAAELAPGMHQLLTWARCSPSPGTKANFRLWRFTTTPRCGASFRRPEAEAITRASALLARHHSLDLGLLSGQQR